MKYHHHHHRGVELKHRLEETWNHFHHHHQLQLQGEKPHCFPALHSRELEVSLIVIPCLMSIWCCAFCMERLMLQIISAHSLVIPNELAKILTTMGCSAQEQGSHLKVKGHRGYMSRMGSSFCVGSIILSFHFLDEFANCLYEILTTMRHCVKNQVCTS